MALSMHLDQVIPGPSDLFRGQRLNVWVPTLVRFHSHTRLLFSIFSPRDEWRETTHQDLPLNVINYVHMFIFFFTHSFYKSSAKIIKQKACVNKGEVLTD